MGCVRDGGAFVTSVTTVPGAVPAPARGITPRTVAVQPDADAAAELADRAAKGELTLRVAETVPLERFRDAYTLLERGRLYGKIVLTPLNADGHARFVARARRPALGHQAPPRPGDAGHGSCPDTCRQLDRPHLNGQRQFKSPWARRLTITCISHDRLQRTICDQLVAIRTYRRLCR